MKVSQFLMSAGMAALFAHQAVAGTVSGVVRDNEGAALEGVLVRLNDPERGLSVSVYSRADGTFTLDSQLEGALELRLRTPYYYDVEEAVELGADEVTLDLAMAPMTSDEDISESLPAAYHFGSLPFETGEGALFSRYQFQRDCLSCHQLGNAFTRYPRSPEEWSVTIERMHSYIGNFDGELRDRRSVLLSTGFNGEPLAVRPKFPLDPALAKAKIYEFRMDLGQVPHDAAVSPDDGLIYTVDQFADHIAVTDIDSGETSYYPMQEEGFPVGGKFASLGMPNLFNHPMRHGPHSLAIGPDGKWYTTNTIATAIGVFNPKTREWEAPHPLGGKALYPHTIRFAKDGVVWFTIASSEQVGRLDTKTGEVTLLDLPEVKPQGISGATVPYGIDVNPKDGSIWYTRLFGDKVGRIDADTLEITEHASPVRGPRRMHFSKDGTLWLTGYAEGMLAKINVDGFTAKVYPMPEFAPGFRPAPYALGIHPDTQDVWLNENMTDRIYRFIPAEERFIAYPVPLRGTYTRDMSFTKDGKVCTSNNPIPVEGLEGGVTELICIDPEAL